MDQNKEDKTCVNITFEVTPQKAKLFREKITLIDENNIEDTKKCVLTLHCRVLGEFHVFFSFPRHLLKVLFEKQICI